MKNLVFVFLLLFASQNAFAWGQTGHRIVAQMCYDNLDEEAREEVDNILGRYTLTQFSVWPDVIKSNKKWGFTYKWHYSTVHPNETAKQVLDRDHKNEGIDGVMEAIELSVAVLKGEKEATTQFEGMMEENGVEPINGSTKAAALAFFIHCIADVHQPMHVGKNNDMGGNKVQVMYFDERKNIHSVWDGALIQSQELSFTEYTTILEKNFAEEKSALEKATLTEWAQEAVELREDIYNSLYDYTDKETGLPQISYNYFYKYIPLMEESLAAAGYRAAYVLNEAFDK